MPEKEQLWDTEGLTFKTLFVTLDLNTQDTPALLETLSKLQGQQPPGSPGDAGSALGTIL